MSGAPSAMQTRQPPVAAWSTGLFDCFDDWLNCCVTCLCPCVTFGQIAEIVERGSSSPSGWESGAAAYSLMMLLGGYQWAYSCFNRSKMRAQLGLRESPCADCCVHWCCGPCALCQEHRELKDRGFHFHMGFGWVANIERRQERASATASPTTPPRTQRMIR